ncbi:MAG: toprim domain-containing protein [Candidatus Babeliaceae bacterium]|nr:toprim domain-containing protein [Candidatus Babeliaceae bacterium]
MTLLELAYQAGINPKWVASTGGGEYHSSCPACGGRDRFFIQPSRQMSKCFGSYCCRQCGIFGDSLKFAQKFLNYSFRDAADAVNATLPEITMSFDRSSKLVSLQEPPAIWKEKATDFVNHAHERLLQETDVLTYLQARGLPVDAVVRYKLGWSDINEFLPRVSWGLGKQLRPDGKQNLLWLPKGIVIPSIEQSGSVVRLKVRRCDWKSDDKLPKYVAISGSMNGLSRVGSKQRIVIVVESELDAYALYYEVGDFACVVAVGSNIKNPDYVVDSLAKSATRLLICSDKDAAGQKMFTKWKKLYPHAKNYPTPIGKDIGEAIEEHGLNVREWILKA